MGCHGLNLGWRYTIALASAGIPDEVREVWVLGLSLGLDPNCYPKEMSGARAAAIIHSQFHGIVKVSKHWALWFTLFSFFPLLNIKITWFSIISILLLYTCIFVLRVIYNRFILDPEKGITLDKRVQTAAFPENPATRAGPEWGGMKGDVSSPEMRRK